MKKMYFGVVLSIILLQAAGHPAQALEIIINGQGTYFYQDQVLGDGEGKQEDERKPEEEKREDERKPENERRENVEFQSGEKRNGDRQNTQSGGNNSAVRKEPSNKPFRSFSSFSDQKLRIKSNAEKTEVILEKNRVEKPSSVMNSFKPQEIMKTDRLQLELPAENRDIKGMPSTRLENAEVERKDKKEQEVEKVQTNIAAPESTPRPSFSPDAQVRLKEVQIERRNRGNETVKIKSKVNDDGVTEFEFESRDAKVKLHGAEFVIDPQTNNVILTTPSGNEHVLTHLPDQALARLEAAGVTGITPGTENEVELETKGDGQVVYKAKTKQIKKLFGLFNRTVESEVELDDSTGEVTTQPVEPTTFLGRLTNSFTF